jgi:hypothetical protein
MVYWTILGPMSSKNVTQNDTNMARTKNIALPFRKYKTILLLFLNLVFFITNLMVNWPYEGYKKALLDNFFD